MAWPLTVGTSSCIMSQCSTTLPSLTRKISTATIGFGPPPSVAAVNHEEISLDRSSSRLSSSRRWRHYTGVMRGISERLREEDRARLRRMTPAQRVAEAFSLGEAAIDAHAAAHGIGREEARRRLERSAQAGRRSSNVLRRLVG